MYLVTIDANVGGGEKGINVDVGGGEEKDVGNPDDEYDNDEWYILFMVHILFLLRLTNSFFFYILQVLFMFGICM